MQSRILLYSQYGWIRARAWCWTRRWFFNHFVEVFSFDSIRFLFFKKKNSSLCSFDDNDFSNVVDNILFSMILYSVTKVSWPFSNVIDSVWPRILRMKKRNFSIIVENWTIQFILVKFIDWVESWMFDVSCPSCLSLRSYCQLV